MSYPTSPSLQWVLRVTVPHLIEQLNLAVHRYYDPLRLPIVLLGFLRFRYRPPIPVLFADWFRDSCYGLSSVLSKTHSGT